MNCMNCGAPLNDSLYCPSCGFDVEVQKKIWHLSNLYYNQGLEKAEIRDLSGAIDLLKRSLKFNKLNIQARNLLGLVYFETGEAVAALSEWVISKNIMPEGNIASDYIDRLQANANKLDVINQTIKKYNECLACCRRGSEDVAVIQLKKILVQNPKLIKAYHLLALVYLKTESYEKARKTLKKAAKIDRTNSTTLRFLKEVDEQTGTTTSLEPRRWGFAPREKQEQSRGQSVAYLADNEVIIQPPTFRESSMAATLLNLGVGFLVGACLVWFLMVPANTQRINREANEKVTGYSNTMASQAAELTKMEEQIAQSEETVSSAQEQIAQAQEQVTSYENLIKAYNSYQNGEYTAAANVMQNINAELLGVDAREIYDNIYSNIQSTMQRSLKSQGEQAFYQENYEEAITALTQAMEIDDTDYETLNLLAHSYRLNGDYDKAVEIFQKIVDTFPGTRRATDAQRYIDNGGHGFDNLEEDSDDDSESGTTGSTGSSQSNTDAAAGGDDSSGSGSSQTTQGGTAAGGDSSTTGNSGSSQNSTTDSSTDESGASGSGTEADPVEQ